MVEIPTGSLVGLCLIILVVGVILGRTSKVMRGFAKAHTRVHAATGGSVDANLRTGDQHVNVTVDAHNVPKVDGRYVLADTAHVVAVDANGHEALHAGAATKVVDAEIIEADVDRALEAIMESVQEGLVSETEGIAAISAVYALQARR